MKNWLQQLQPARFVQGGSVVYFGREIAPGVVIALDVWYWSAN